MIFEKEITVSVNTNKEDLIAYLISTGFKKIDEYTVDDIYYVPNNTDLNQNALDILKTCVLVRTINDNKHYLLYKYKEYDKDENIINQGKQKVMVYDKDDAKSFLEVLGYQEIIRIVDNVIVYEKDGLELAIEYVNDEYLYIEIEENEKYDTIEKLISGLEATGIDYDKSNYFVKKAKVILNKNKISK